MTVIPQISEHNILFSFFFFFVMPARGFPSTQNPSSSDHYIVQVIYWISSGNQLVFIFIFSIQNNIIPLIYDYCYGKIIV